MTNAMAIYSSDDSDIVVGCLLNEKPCITHLFYKGRTLSIKCFLSFPTGHLTYAHEGWQAISIGQYCSLRNIRLRYVI